MGKIAIAVIGLLIFANHAHAWVEPQPGQEIPAPINTSSQEQTKLGILDIGNWIKVLTNPFNFNVGMQAPKFCIQKPDGTTSCCPPAAGQDWSACASNSGGGLNTKWVWNVNNFSSFIQGYYTSSYFETGTMGSYDLVATDPEGSSQDINPTCKCHLLSTTIPSGTWANSGVIAETISHAVNNKFVMRGATTCAKSCSSPARGTYPAGPIPIN